MMIHSHFVKNDNIHFNTMFYSRTISENYILSLFFTLTISFNLVNVCVWNRMNETMEDMFTFFSFPVMAISLSWCLNQNKPPQHRSSATLVPSKANLCWYQWRSSLIQVIVAKGNRQVQLSCLYTLEDVTPSSRGLLQFLQTGGKIQLLHLEMGLAVVSHSLENQPVLLFPSSTVAVVNIQSNNDSKEMTNSLMLILGWW